MKTFLKRLVIYLTLTVLIVAGIVMYRFIRCYSVSYVLPQTTHTLFAGASHIEKGIDEQFYPHSKNIAKASERYMFTYLKLRKILEVNEQIDTIFLQMAPTDIWENTDSRYFDENSISFYLPTYYPYFSKEEWMVYQHDKMDIFLHIASKLFHYIPRNINSLGGYKAVDQKFSRENREKMHVPESYRGHEINYRYLNKIIDLTEEKGIKLYFIYMPVLFASDYYDQDYYYESYKRNFSRTELLDFSQLELPDSLYFDENHLNRYGADHFTKKLREDISKLNGTY